MKVHQAIQAMRGYRGDNDLWARPMTWRGSGMAICIQDHDRRRTDGLLLVVPGARAGHPWTPNIKTLLVDWETVDPGVVLAEND